ncbi:hypothetical protein AVEN_92553-1 [Araneus ventricosus]|uniref:Uncharacterized protein n=1 Tax=Araneus ventricosus TaxID=182803 RepID=A0A4Y2AIA4_ARAVE|nr:hypothetical protein AVEN_92553-1 [Araneus ventricosus]
MLIASAKQKSRITSLLPSTQFRPDVEGIGYRLHQPLRGSPSLGEYGCPNPEVPRDLYSLPVYPPLCLLLSADPSQELQLSMRSYRHSVCFLLLMDSQNPTCWPCVATH